MRHVTPCIKVIRPATQRAQSSDTQQLRSPRLAILACTVNCVASFCFPILLFQFSELAMIELRRSEILALFADPVEALVEAAGEGLLF